MSAPAAVAAGLAPSQSELEWDRSNAKAPRLAATSAGYLEQIALSLRLGSVIVTVASLRFLCCYLIEEHPRPRAQGRRPNRDRRLQSESGAAHHTAGPARQPNHRRQRLGVRRTFFDRIIEWDWDDAPARCPIFTQTYRAPRHRGPSSSRRRRDATSPVRWRPRPIRFGRSESGSSAPACGWASCAPWSRRRGADRRWLLDPGACRQASLRPLRALHPTLLPLLDHWQASHGDNSLGLLLTNDGRPLNRHAVTRMVNRAGRRPGCATSTPISSVTRWPPRR